MSVEFVKRKFGETLTELMIYKGSKRDMLELSLLRKEGLYSAKAEISYDYVLSLKREIENKTISYKDVINVGTNSFKLVAYELNNKRFFRGSINDDITTGHFVIDEDTMLEILEEVKQLIHLLDNKG